MKRTFIYVYENTFNTERGHQTHLRRSDGKRVTVTRKRLNELGDRLIFPSDFKRDGEKN